MSDATRAEMCVAACAEAFRGDGEILASAMGVIPMLGARLARATFARDLLISDGEATLLDEDGVAEGWIPFRTVFDTLWAGRRHVMMGASQIDRFGNQNIACIGDWQKPKAQLLGVRGAPGNTINHATSYWVPNHSPRVFVDRVDFVSGIGWDRGAAEIRVVVSNLGVFDFDTPDNAMRLRWFHPDVTVEEIAAATGFPLSVEDASETPSPGDEALRVLREVLDPSDTRDAA
ncbi:MAG: CoA-transferase [Actinobacteria bacterium]|nr:CoA-transferase [Actinomycetota bacterium]